MSNLTKRVFAGIIGVPLILIAAYFGGIYLLIFSILISSLALQEFYSMFEKKGFAPSKYIAIIFSVLIFLFLNKIKTEPLKITALILFMLVIFTAVEISRSQNKNPLNVMISFFGLFYIAVPLIILNLLSQSYEYIVIYIFILIWTCDSLAYFGGRLFGKHKLSDISPNKTWEGSATGFIFTVILSLLFHFIFPDKLNLTDAVATGLIVGIFSQIGDLFESLLKRYCGVKDSSGLIPGHGGILDRFDSLIFVTPVVYIYFLFVK